MSSANVILSAPEVWNKGSTEVTVYCTKKKKKLALHNVRKMIPKNSYLKTTVTVTIIPYLGTLYIYRLFLL